VTLQSHLPRLWVFVTRAVLGMLVTVGAVVTVGSLMGYRSLTVVSGSMEPTLDVGDVVIVRPLAPTNLRVGDVVTFRDPTDEDLLITHRVRALRIANGQVGVTTKGDANNTEERWTVPVDGSVGLVRYQVHRLGFALAWAASRTGRLALVVVPVLVLGILELMAIWRPGRRSPTVGFGGG
jgi:signal peptidase I